MKKYIIITMSICNIGGAEQYVYNKIKFLESCGYDVYVFSSMTRDILIHEFTKFKELIFPALMYSPFCFRNSYIRKIISIIKEKIHYEMSDEIFIEANSISAGLWGEILARETKSSCYVFNLQETHCYSKEEKEFLYKKLNEHKLSGITSKSVFQMLSNYQFEFDDSMHWKAFCNNVVDDCEDNYSKFFNSKAKYNFGCVGRLEKPFLIELLKSLIVYFKQNNDIEFNLILIGGSNKKGKAEKIRNLFSQVKNVNLIITGFLYPIPRELINNVDIFISTAGSADATYYENRPTIKVSPENSKPIGIMGGTFEVDEKSMYECDEQHNLQYFIDLILGDKVIIRHTDFLKCYYLTMYSEFERQMSFMVSNSKNYYQAERIMPLISPKNIIYTLIGRIFGGKTLHILLEIFRGQ